VTQVLEDCGIIDYSMIPGDTRQMALERGRDVHTATQFDDEGDLDETTIDELLPYVQAWRNFRKEAGMVDFYLVEHRMADPAMNFAGTLDRFTLEGGGILIDIKTNLAPWWVRIQLAAYKHLLDQEVNSAARRMAVELHKDGTFRVIEFPVAQQRADFQTFCAALRIYQEKQEEKRKGI
jgi:hypothetical protein